MQQARKDGESMHNQPSLMRAVSRVGALVVMASALIILGCDGGGGDEFRDATPADLENRAFTFVVEGEPATFTFGSFDADGDSDAATGIFTVQSNGDIVGGTARIGSCTFSATFGAFEGEEPQAIDEPIVADPCEVSKEDGRLRARFMDPVSGEVLLTSNLPTDVEILLEFNVDVSPANEVDPPVLLGDRPETGTVTIQLLSGNILEYTMVVNDLTDSLSNAHIHSGARTENGDVLITLVGEPVQAGRTSTIQFDTLNPSDPPGTARTASIPLSDAEVAALGDLDNPLYVNIHSVDAPAGLLRGQLRD